MMRHQQESTAREETSQSLNPLAGVQDLQSARDEQAEVAGA